MKYFLPSTKKKEKVKKNTIKSTRIEQKKIFASTAGLKLNQLLIKKRHLEAENMALQKEAEILKSKIEKLEEGKK